MEILIVSKTRKSDAACVGGIVVGHNRYVRLLNPGNRDQRGDTDFNIGDIWEINYSDREHLEPPHIEDVIINSKVFVRRMENISSYILNSGVTIYRGSPSTVFNEILHWTENGSGYLDDRDEFPGNSVGFWISDRELKLEGVYYIYTTSFKFMLEKRLRYVGFEVAVKIIPAGTLIRVSLARWWRPDNADMPKRCYLQLSGWY